MSEEKIPYFLNKNLGVFSKRTPGTTPIENTKIFFENGDWPIEGFIKDELKKPKELFNNALIDLKRILKGKKN